MPAMTSSRNNMVLLEEERKDTARMFDPLMENVFESFFDFNKDDELKLFESGNLLPETLSTDTFTTTIGSSSSTMLEKKRKSLDWGSKPVYKRKLQATQSTPAPSQMPTFAPTQQQRLDVFPVDPLPFIHEFPVVPSHSYGNNLNSSYEEDLAMLSDLFLDDLKQIKPVKKELLKKRKSEDWGRKPVFETKKRAKWSNDELQQLWQGISKHGNNWTDITEEIESRSYCQIKDKGRRCLFLLGWSTGRSKLETDESNVQAKKIANKVLSQMYTNSRR